MTGSQIRFETPTHKVTVKLSMLASFNTVLPNVGVYAVIM